MESENKERRKINQAILDRINRINPNDIKIDGQPVRTITGDRMLAMILGVSIPTVLAWRHQDIIPYKHRGKTYPVTYNLKNVLYALKQHSLSDMDYAVKLAESENQLQMQHLQDRIKQLVERIERLENGQEEK